MASSADARIARLPAGVPPRDAPQAPARSASPNQVSASKNSAPSGFASRPELGSDSRASRSSVVALWRKATVRYCARSGRTRNARASPAMDQRSARNDPRPPPRRAPAIPRRTKKGESGEEGWGRAGTKGAGAAEPGGSAPAPAAHAAGAGGQRTVAGRAREV